MGRIGFSEILLIAIACLLLFGASKLPQIGASLGKAVREFKRALNGEKPDGAEGDDARK